MPLSKIGREGMDLNEEESSEDENMNETSFNLRSLNLH
jgi:hypothetical protein